MQAIERADRKSSLNALLEPLKENATVRKTLEERRDLSGNLVDFFTSYAKEVDPELYPKLADALKSDVQAPTLDAWSNPDLWEELLSHFRAIHAGKPHSYSMPEGPSLTPERQKMVGDLARTGKRLIHLHAGGLNQRVYQDEPLADKFYEMISANQPDILLTAGRPEESRKDEPKERKFDTGYLNGLLIRFPFLKRIHQYAKKYSDRKVVVIFFRDRMEDHYGLALGDTLAGKGVLRLGLEALHSERQELRAALHPSHPEAVFFQIGLVMRHLLHIDELNDYALPSVQDGPSSLWYRF